MVCSRDDLWGVGIRDGHSDRNQIASPDVRLSRSACRGRPPHERAGSVARRATHATLRARSSRRVRCGCRVFLSHEGRQVIQHTWSTPICQHLKKPRNPVAVPRKRERRLRRSCSREKRYRTCKPCSSRRLECGSRRRSASPSCGSGERSSQPGESAVDRIRPNGGARSVIAAQPHA
jgi:hypothetical protein